MAHDPIAPDTPAAGIFDVDALVRDLAPMRRMRVAEGLALALAVVAVCGLAIAMGQGVRDDVARGSPHWMFILRSATMLGLGMTAALAALSSATPSVGASKAPVWKWALAGAMLFPAGALIVVVTHITAIEEVTRTLDPAFGVRCLVLSVMCGGIVGAAMTAWIKRGAPVDLARAGWLIGLASGSLGAAAYSITCSENIVLYIGTWYTLAVAGCAVAGRLIVPAILRW